MLERLKERLKQLENKAAANIAVRYPDDADGFICAVVGTDAAERYRHGSGYDVMAALCSTARDDWSDYEPPENYSDDDDECQGLTFT